MSNGIGSEVIRKEIWRIAELAGIRSGETEVVAKTVAWLEAVDKLPAVGDSGAGLTDFFDSDGMLRGRFAEVVLEQMRINIAAYRDQVLGF